MTDTTAALAYFDKIDKVDGDERAYHWFWIVGAHGAVTFRFYIQAVKEWQVGRFALITAYGRREDGTPYEVSGDCALYHWPAHRDDPPGVDDYDSCCLEKENCEFLETHCRHFVGSSLNQQHLQDAYVRGDHDYIRAWLADEYHIFFIDGYPEDT